MKIFPYEKILEIINTYFLFQTTRRNYPIAMQRPSWKNRGKNFSDLGVQIDCGKVDMTTIKNVLHFVTTGTCKFMFNVRKELYFVPVIMILKCLTDQSDKQIFDQLIEGISLFNSRMIHKSKIILLSFCQIIVIST